MTPGSQNLSSQGVDDAPQNPKAAELRDGDGIFWDQNPPNHEINFGILVSFCMVNHGINLGFHWTKMQESGKRLLDTSVFVTRRLGFHPRTGSHRHSKVQVLEAKSW